ncbi:MAG TPA: ABC transporter permease [Gemmataceae bacterium]|nr:ABC transporter permease [Gemmataceae bacterium]
MRFYQFILKNVLQRKARSALTMIGVAIAVTAVVALVGIADGFERSFRELYERRGVDLLVVRAGSSEHLSSSVPQQVGEQIRQLPGVRAVSPGLMDVVSFEQYNANLTSVALQGWAADSFLFDDLRLISGRRLQAGDENGVMLGMVLARNLGKTSGDKLEIANHFFTVAGVFESFNPLESGSAVLLIGTLQALMDRPNQVTGFQIILEDAADKKALLERVRQEIESLRNAQGRPWGIAATPTRDYVRSTSQIRMAEAMAWMTSIIALVIGAVGVLNTMIMSVFERTREIGILRAIGWRKTRVVRLILYESVLLSIAGAAAGIVAAVLLTRALTWWPLVNGLIRGDVSPQVIVQGFLIALAVGLIGGAYPAYRGAYLLPTEALRHE